MTNKKHELSISGKITPQHGTEQDPSYETIRELNYSGIEGQD